MKNDNVYIYNDDFNSLLSLINVLLKNNIKPFNIKSNEYRPNLLDNLIYLKVDETDVIGNYIKLLGHNNFKIIWYVFLSNDDNKELIIYYCLLNFFKYREKVMYMRNLKCVSEALRISNYVSRESHRFKGFVRFKELKNNILYAEIEPENNILSILSYHFKNRLNNEYWIIKDVKREIISVYDKKEFYILNENDFKFLELEVSDCEENIEVLWKSFYKTIGISSRKNERCRMNFMPKKYWKYLLEVSDEIEKSN